MKAKALFLALVIAGATALSYTVHTQDAEQAIEIKNIRIPRNG